MIAKGSYTATAVSHELGKTPNKGTSFIRLVFKIEDDGEFRGHQISWDGYLTEKTTERTMDSLEHAGWDGASLSRPVGIGSTKCRITVDHEENPENGKTYARVQWVNALGSGGKLKEESKMSQSDANALDNQFKTALFERRQKNGSKPAQQRRSEPDEMPEWMRDDPEDFPR